MDRDSFIALANAKYGDSFDYSHLPEQMKRVPEIIVCKVHGKQRMIPRDHLRSKHGCPECAATKVAKAPKDRNAEFIEKATVKYDGKYDYQHVDMDAGPKDKVKIGCPIHGIVEATLKSHLHSETGCYNCGRSKGYDTVRTYVALEDLVQAISEVIDDDCMYSDFNVADRTVVVTCPRHGSVTKDIRVPLSGRSCKLCGYDNRTITPEEFLTRAKAVHGDDFEYDTSELRSVNHRIKVKHKCGRTFTVRVSNHLAGQTCMACKSSIGEKRIAEFLKRNRVDFEQEFRIAGYGYRYDFHLPALGILIEYDGEQHFRAVDFFGGHEAFVKTKERDKEKTGLAKAAGFNLIRISYKEFDRLEGHLSRAIDSVFKYRVNDLFYRNYTALCYSLGLPGNTTVKSVERYRTFSNLSPPNQ